ncbi:MAG: peptidoglycan synthetase [Flavobacteriales bacterium]|nr:peptidoglycan synthetase [Flavobacteriales bacterium]
MKVHFIAIGGSAMHNLAIALAKSGDQVSGSDDEIVEPSKSRLQRYGLLPAEEGWFPEKISADLDAVILGMHARMDNPELKRANELGLKVYSYPEYIYERTKNKTRIVIGGSHGKTTITSMVLHALNKNGIPHDYMVGAQLEGYECMVGFSDDSKLAVIEGDEYLSSPEDRRPKFHLYQPHIALISGIAWDHINVFPTFEIYVDQFRKFIDLIEEGGTLVYFEGDQELTSIVPQHGNNINKISYQAFPNVTRDGITYLLHDSKEIPLLIFGDHNMQNLNGARWVCESAGMKLDSFLDAMKSFKGAARRLELVKKNDTCSIYKDFAHSPSKLKATTAAVKNQFPQRKLIACMELHTFSSLTEEFLKEYKDSMKLADIAFVYFNPHTIAHKKLKSIEPETVQQSFGTSNVRVFTDSNTLVNELQEMKWEDSNLLLMTSGNFDGVDFNRLADQLIS